MNDKKKRMDYWVDQLPKVYYIEKIDRQKTRFHKNSTRLQISMINSFSKN